MHPELPKRQAADYSIEISTMLDKLLEDTKDNTEALYTRTVIYDLLLTFATAGLFSVVVY